ncbi:MAG TPA: CHASE3 domain-containing protein [Polyangiaceae bacterium]|nr:CHASE3 domain-containing protein [Polyangiaceae bacterium]
MKNLLRAKRVVWGLMFVLMTSVALLSYFAGNRYVASERAVEEAIAMQQAIDATLSLLKDAETGQRGFLITGDGQFLAPHRAALEELPRHLAELRGVTRGDPKRSARLAQLEKLIQEKVAFMDESIRLRRAGDETSAVERVRSGRGKELMDAIRSECSAMTQHQQRLLQVRRRQAEAARHLAGWGVGVGSALAILLSLFNLLGVHRDVKRLQQAAEEAAASAERFRLLTENTSDLVRLLDLTGKATYVSPSIERLLGFGVQEFLELPAKSLMHPDDVATAGSILRDISSGTVDKGISTYRLRNKTGEYRYFEVRWSVQKDSRGTAVSIHTTARDVTERRQAEQQLAMQAAQLRDLSLRDELTKLYNRRGFMEVAGQAHAQALRDKRMAALIFIDLNGMKRINDELGHEAGDDALLDTAKLIDQALRESDVTARLGGDEFVAFAVDFSVDDLDNLRARMRALADEYVVLNNRAYRLSLSVGAAVSDPQTPKPLEELLELADASMYEQKRARQAAGNISVKPPVAPPES